jgi:hypothetical protein
VFHLFKFMLYINKYEIVVPHSSVARPVGDDGRGSVTEWYQSHGFNAEPGWAG